MGSESCRGASTVFDGAIKQESGRSLCSNWKVFIAGTGLGLG